MAKTIEIKSTTLQKMKPEIGTAIQKFENLQRGYSAVGASDTEPDFVFHSLIKKAVNLVDFPENLNSHGWELYSSVKGAGLAAHHMTKAARKVYDAIRTRAGEEDIALLRAYAWRVQF